MNQHLRPILRQILWPKLPQFSLILLLLLISTGLQTLSPWPFKILLDNVLGHELLSTNTLIGQVFANLSAWQASIAVVILYMGIIVLSRIADFLYASYNNYVIQRVTRDFASACFHNLTRLDYSYFRRQSNGNYLYQLDTNTTAPAELLEDSLFPLATSTLYLIVTFTVLANLNLTMATITLVSLPILSISYYLFNQKITNTSYTLQQKNGLLYSFLEQVISQLKIIQAYVNERFFSTQYRSTIWDNLKTELTLYRYGILLTLSNGMIIGLTYAFIIAFGANQVIQGTLTVGLLMVYVFYLDNLVSPVLTIIDSLASYRQAIVSLNNTAPIFDPSHHLQDTGTLSQLSQPNIILDNVSLTDQGTPLLSQVSLHFQPGHLNVIVGDSGSGKSTLLLLLMRFYPQWQGQIRLGDLPIEQYQLDFLRRQVGYVPQETVLFDQNIAEIIRFGHASASSTDIEQSARLACAHEFILAKPYGYQTRVGELGNLLSGGERQRLLLARAILRQTPILLLDEIFSGQDQPTQKQLVCTLRSLAKTKTVILVTHITSILDPHDNVIVIQDGHIMTNKKGVTQSMPKKSSSKYKIGTGNGTGSVFELVSKKKGKKKSGLKPGTGNGTGSIF